jgi:chromosome segregation protein
MYLEKLQINGFKSFAQNLELSFVRGITAIVGPNGSGKSNIADAVRWVLGEQSMKTIRGKKSVDVIFAGSDKKARLGMAEVSLYFNNEDLSAPIDYSELAITRRFYRSGEGEYLINSAKSRLSDIQLLMAKANVGHRTYSVIGQGQIDAVLVASPIERKDFFDEATGVKQYQMKRDQALRKLEHAYENMKQGKLMINEIDPHLKMLTRQVRRLEQKELVEKELKGYQSYLYYKKWHECSLAQTELTKQLGLLDQQLVVKTKEVKNLSEQLKNEGLSASREDEYAKLQNEYERLQKVRQEYLRQLAVFEGQKDLKFAQVNGHDAVWATRRLQEITTKLGEAQENLRGLIDNLKVYQTALIEKQTSQTKIINEFELLEKKMVDYQGDHAVLANTRNNINKIIAEIKKYKNLWKQQSNLTVTEVLEILSTWEENLHLLITEIIESADKKSLDETISSLKGELQRVSFSRDNLVNEISELQVDIKVGQANVGHAEQRMQELQSEQQQLQHMVAVVGNTENMSIAEKTVQKELQVIVEQIESVNIRLKDFNRDEQQKKEKLLAKQVELQSCQQQAQNLQQQLGELTARKARYDTKEEDLALEVHRELGEYLTFFIDKWRIEVPTLAEAITEEEILTRIEQLKKRREMIGGIEPEAIVEYKNVKEKYDFLSGQINDLTSAMTKLKDTIAELDEIISKQFSENFKKIGELFNTYFRMLFNGGRAELVLQMSDDKKEEESEEDPIDQDIDAVSLLEDEFEKEEDELKQLYKSKSFIQGIDIKATPPGKKMKGISMLSGGERALTSIALICAMIANNPSPFVVLDEVDAALDEANSLRFAEIVSELSQQTQFVIITHNRATMEKANILYGVTMGADGVSNLLSVKFEEAQEYANRF